MKKHFISFTLIIIILSTILISCKHSIVTNSKNPVTLTLWHNYGGQLKNVMDAMVNDFNETVGADEGVIISVTSISGSSTLHEKLTMAANGVPGAPALPDITTTYPVTADILAKKGLLTDLEEYFTSEELSEYIPQFIQEGRINGDRLYVFPTAKSTEVLFVNTTLFNRFAKDTGVKIEDLQTFEGIIKASEFYYDWTDKKTPAIDNDGKMFFLPDSLYNFSQIAYEQFGDEFIKDGTINLTSQQFQKIWNCYYKPSVLGYVAIFDGYATDLAKTGDIVCSTGSTAGVSFFSPTVTYADNTTEPAEIAILPYPVFEGGQKVAMQRGAGMSVIKSTEEKEYLASIFLKWFTSPENNIKFTSSTGYLPVTEEAFGDLMSREIENTPENIFKELLNTSRLMQKEYKFYISPLFDDAEELQEKYETRLKQVSSESRKNYIELLKTNEPKVAYEAVSKDLYKFFIDSFLEK